MKMTFFLLILSQLTTTISMSHKHKFKSKSHQNPSENRDQRFINHVSENFVSPYFSAIDSPNRLNVSNRELHFDILLYSLFCYSLSLIHLNLTLHSSIMTDPTKSLSTRLDFGLEWNPFDWKSGGRNVDDAATLKT